MPRKKLGVEKPTHFALSLQKQQNGFWSVVCYGIKVSKTGRSIVSYDISEPNLRLAAMEQFKIDCVRKVFV